MCHHGQSSLGACSACLIPDTCMAGTKDHSSTVELRDLFSKKIEDWGDFALLLCYKPDPMV